MHPNFFSCVSCVHQSSCIPFFGPVYPSVSQCTTSFPPQLLPFFVILLRVHFFHHMFTSLSHHVPPFNTPLPPPFPPIAPHFSCITIHCYPRKPLYPEKVSRVSQFISKFVAYPLLRGYTPIESLPQPQPRPCLHHPGVNPTTPTKQKPQKTQGFGRLTYTHTHTLTYGSWTPASPLGQAEAKIQSSSSTSQTPEQCTLIIHAKGGRQDVPVIGLQCSRCCCFASLAVAMFSSELLKYIQQLWVSRRSVLVSHGALHMPCPVVRDTSTGNRR